MASVEILSTGGVTGIIDRSIPYQELILAMTGIIS
jgi:hypothetical protein